MLTYVVGVCCVFKTYHFTADIPKKVEKTSHDIAVFIHLQNGSSWVKMAANMCLRTSFDGPSCLKMELPGLNLSLQASI